MKRRGVEYVFAFGVDNPLCEVADPAYMGYCIQRNVKMGYKVVDRRGAHITLHGVSSLSCRRSHVRLVGWCEQIRRRRRAWCACGTG